MLQRQTYRRRVRVSRSSGINSCLVYLFLGVFIILVAPVIILGMIKMIAGMLPSPIFQILTFFVITGMIALLIVLPVIKHQNKRAKNARLIIWQRQEQDRLAVLERQEQDRKEREQIARMQSLGNILALTPKQFEQFTGRILEHCGLHQVQHIGGSGDLGADLTAIDHQGNKVIVQCKRYGIGHSVGSRDVQMFIGMMNVHHKAQKGIFVTTSEFTQPATTLAKEHGISLVDGIQLISMLQAIKRQQKERGG